jgi:hypothetical protein
VSYLDEPEDIYWEAIRERDGIARERANLAVMRQHKRERDARRAALAARNQAELTAYRLAESV